MLKVSFCSPCTLVWHQGLHVFVFKHLENFVLNTLLTSSFTIFISKSIFLARKQPKCYILYNNGGHPSFFIHLSSCRGKLSLPRCSMMWQVHTRYLDTGSCYFVVPCTLYDKAKKIIFSVTDQLQERKASFSCKVASLYKARTAFTVLLL